LQNSDNRVDRYADVSPERRTVMRTTFTSEWVTEGHPDKICDRVSDAVLDEVLRQDPKGRVACETFATVGMVMVGGEITTRAWVDLSMLVRTVLRDIAIPAPKSDCARTAVQSSTSSGSRLPISLKGSIKVAQGIRG
jgi:S-adenosylmethionine synthetase